jgi:glycosyltransferase involved in cell wall biosynthesis
VATSVGGVPEAVVDGQTGWLVPPRDVAALAAGVAEALASPDRLARAGESGRQRVMDHFLIDRNVRAHEVLYKELAAGS